MQYGIAVDRVTNEGRIDFAVNRRRGNGEPAGRVLTSRTPAVRMHWNRAASGMLAGALEAPGTVQVADRRKPSEGSGLHEHLAPRALHSGRTSRPDEMGRTTPVSVAAPHFRGLDCNSPLPAAPKGRTHPFAIPIARTVVCISVARRRKNKMKDVCIPGHWVSLSPIITDFFVQTSQLLLRSSKYSCRRRTNVHLSPRFAMNSKAPWDIRSQTRKFR